jgi:anti-anti-sigma regulatory factor
MERGPCRHLVVEARAPDVKVVRFTRPDLRAQLDNYASIEDSELFQELGEVLTGLVRGDKLVLNLGLIEVFTSTLLCFLLRVREIVRGRGARLLLCQFRNEHREILEVTRTLRLFTITGSEAKAIYQAAEG